MNINLEVRYYTERYSWLCFRHAVQEAVKGEDVKTEVDEFEYYMGSKLCSLCALESGL